MGRIENEWLSVINRALAGVTISKLQYQEMRRCFYAGFNQACKIHANEILSLRSPEEAFTAMEKLRAELWDFEKELIMRLNSKENNSENV